MGWRNQDTPATTPEWFWRAIETEPEEGSVEVADCAVHYRCWGKPSSDKPGILLAHGMHAHSRWWDFIAPQLMDDYYLVALDFTGMGDSDYRYDYTAAIFADEIAAVMDAAVMGRGILVGHSFGGYISVKAAARHADKISHLVLVDTVVRSPQEREAYEEQNIMGKGASLFPDAQTARQHFRLQPPQPCANTYLVEYIARTSIMRVDEGWTWKFDEDLRDSLAGSGWRDDHVENFKSMSCPMGLIYGEKSSIYTENTVPYMQSLKDKPFPMTMIDDAHHHLFLDQPLAFVAALRAMLERLGAAPSKNS